MHCKEPTCQTDGQITLTEDIPVTTSTESTPSTTSLENVEINIIQKQPGHHSKSKGHSYSKDVNEFDVGQENRKRKNRRRKNGQRRRNKESKKDLKSDYESNQYHGGQDTISSSPAFHLQHSASYHAVITVIVIHLNLF